MKRLILLNLRKSKNMSQEELAYKANINRSYYGFIENGKRNPSYQIAINISEALDTSIEKAFPNEFFFGNKCYNKKQEVDCN